MNVCAGVRWDASETLRAILGGSVGSVLYEETGRGGETHVRGEKDGTTCKPRVWTVGEKERTAGWRGAPHGRRGHGTPAMTRGWRRRTLGQQTASAADERTRDRAGEARPLMPTPSLPNRALAFPAAHMHSPGAAGRLSVATVCGVHPLRVDTAGIRLPANTQRGCINHGDGGRTGNYLCAWHLSPPGRAFKEAKG